MPVPVPAQSDRGPPTRGLPLSLWPACVRVDHNTDHFLRVNIIMKHVVYTLVFSANNPSCPCTAKISIFKIYLATKFYTKQLDSRNSSFPMFS